MRTRQARRCGTPTGDDVELPTEARIVEAARIKAEHPLAYPDAFAAATVISHDATLWAGDPELLVEQSPWRWQDLRS